MLRTCDQIGCVVNLAHCLSKGAEFGILLGMLWLLGPVELRAGAVTVNIGPTKRRALLAALAVDANRLVGVATLIDRVWGERPPDGARATLYAHISRLRTTLAPLRPSWRIRQLAGGYLLDVDPCLIDLHRFGELAGASSTLLPALRLWRGPAFADLSGQWVEQTRSELSRRRLDAMLRWGHGVLADRPDLVVEEAYRLLSDHPYDEPLVGLTMRALAATGRRSDALKLYVALTDRLACDLGIEPASELQDLHASIVGVRVRTTRAVELPAEVVPFVGRESDLARLSRALPEGGICLLTGTAGVGKTALALRWAHVAGARFPDGALYVDLRGYDPAPPLSAADALAGFLRSLGVPAVDVPGDVAERAARFRGLLHGRRLLIVLDNAADAEQVRPLLPASAGCAVLVTSRDAMPGLVARQGAIRVELLPMPLADAVALLRRLVGGRVDAEPEYARRLAELCARLPLVLRVAAEIAVDSAESPVSDVVNSLADEGGRLDLLDAGGDPRSAVAAVLSWSYATLSEPARSAFRRLSLHPGAHFDVGSAAALASDAAPETLRELIRAHLVSRVDADRYSMHDLLRAYALGLIRTAERSAAMLSLADYYLRSCAAAMNALYPAERARRPPIMTTDRFAGPAEALVWLDCERRSLLAEPGPTAIALSGTVARYLERGGYYPEAIRLHSVARSQAVSDGDVLGEAVIATDLGNVYWLLGRYDDASESFGQAVALAEKVGDLVVQTRASANLGSVDVRRGRYDQAAAWHLKALDLARASGDQTSQARALANLGGVRSHQGRQAEAASLIGSALDVFIALGSQDGQARTLSNLAEILSALGRHSDAAARQAQALVWLREMGDREGEADSLIGLGDIRLRLNAHTEATTLYDEALAIFEVIGNQQGQARAHNGRGAALRAAGASAAARHAHVRALKLADTVGDPLEQARAHEGLADTYDRDGDSKTARRHWDQALDRYSMINSPGADEVRNRLAAASR